MSYVFKLNIRLNELLYQISSAQFKSVMSLILNTFFFSLTSSLQPINYVQKAKELLKLS